jgi:hypothetical protein
MRRITVAALAGVAVLFAGTALAQQNADFSKVEIETTNLGNKTYMLQGQGGNIAVAVGTDGIIMVDREFAPLHDKIKAAIEPAAGPELDPHGQLIQTVVTTAPNVEMPSTAGNHWRCASRYKY